jgi:hypothetical protein
MQGCKEGTFQVEYRPSRLSAAQGGTTEALLEFRIAELGTYRYALSLTALPAVAEPSLRFDAPLGGGETETFTFRCFNKQAQAFACSVGRPAFFQIVGAATLNVPACAAWEGQEVKVAVRFEPEAAAALDRSARRAIESTLLAEIGSAGFSDEGTALTATTFGQQYAGSCNAGGMKLPELHVL